MPALDRFEQSFPVGVHCIVGVNGAGKSTLFRLLATAGHGVEISGEGWTLRSGRQAQRNIGFLTQATHLPAHMTALGYVAYAAWLKGIAHRDVADRARIALDSVDLGDKVNQRCGRLSGGEQRRVQLAGASVHTPDLLLLDEPTNMLDPFQRVRFHELIRQVSTNSVVLLSTHLLDEVLALADCVTVLHEGRCRWHGSLAELGAESTEQLAAALREFIPV